MARFISGLGETSQPWLVVLDDLPETTLLDGLRPEGPAGRLLVTSRRPAIAIGRGRTEVVPVGFFSVREALNCLTEPLRANPVQRLGAIDLVETLGLEPLALAQASSAVASSALDCLGYRDLFVRRRAADLGCGRRDAIGGHADLERIGDAESLLRRTAAYRERSLPHGHPLAQAISQSMPNIEKVDSGQFRWAVPDPWNMGTAVHRRRLP